jgi:hypothetical protein
MSTLEKYTGPISDLQFQPRTSFKSTVPANNPLIFALNALLPSRDAVPSLATQNPETLTNEQMTALALQQAMAMRR